MDASVEIAGVTFRNPVVVASSPLTRSYKHIAKCIRHGAGGAVTKTITYDPMQRVQPKPRMHVVNPKDALAGRFYSFYSVDLMSELEPLAWARELAEARREIGDQGVLVASIAGRTYEEWEKLASLMQEAGADMLELNLSCPHIEEGGLMGKAASYDAETVSNVVKAVKRSASIPVAGKLTPQGANPVLLARTMASSGIDALVSTARFQGLLIDVESGKPAFWPCFGGYGGPWQVPISVAWTAHIAMEKLGKPIVGSGGISTWRDAASFILAGASAVQVCTSAMAKGYGVITEIERGIESWLGSKGFGSVEEAVGLALKGVVALEKLERAKAYRVEVDEAKCTKCGVCEKTCPYGAVTLGEKISVDWDACDNCNLCASLCPADAMVLSKI
ncbi:MAG: 4Fe-4S binding protein [Candidatus Brockarchaeota archaeon]|nr:4Fe-4S binding protein [Candidatus Brockarchaeota archaeon]